MTSPAVVPNSSPPGVRTSFYGWWIVLATFVVGFVVSGGALQSMGIMVIPIAESLNVGRAEIGTVMSLQLIVNSVLSPWVGSLLARRSIRKIMLVGVLVLGLGLTITSSANSLWLLYLGWGLLAGVGSTMCLFLPCIAVVSNWFSRLRGRALGLSQLGPPAAGAVVPPILAVLSAEFGWRASLLFLAAAVLLLLPLIRFFLVDRPEDYGQFPDGDPDPPPTVEAPSHEMWTIRRAIRSPDVWLLVGMMGATSAPAIAMTVHLIPYATDTGLTGAQAALVFSVTTISAALGGPVFGALGDYTSTKFLLVSAALCQFVGILLIFQLHGQLGLSFAGAMLGLGYGGLTPLWALAIGKMFGVESVTRIFGVCTPLAAMFYIGVAPLMGYVYDTTGSYELALQLLLIAPLLAIGCLILLRIPEVTTAAP